MKFKLTEYEFDVPMQTIDSRIQNERLEIWQTGPTSWLLLGMEVHLKVLILTTAKIHAAINVSQTIALANDLIWGTPVEAVFISFKKKWGLPITDTDVLGLAWWRNFKQRNPDISLKVGMKFEWNWHAYLTYQAFTLMCNNIESALIDSGNAVKFETPVHMDKMGNIVNDETLAFGLPVTINIIRPGNVFYMDEIGRKTHGTNDKQKEWWWEEGGWSRHKATGNCRNKRLTFYHCSYYQCHWGTGHGCYHFCIEVIGKIVNLLPQLNECGCSIQDLKLICSNTKVMKLRLFKTQHIASLHLPIFWVAVLMTFHMLICVVNQTPILTKLFSFTYYH